MFQPLSSLVIALALADTASAAVVPRAYSIPNANGFPSPDAAQKLTIAQQAGGMLPNGALPTKLGKNSIAAFQLITFNELFETAYFSSLVTNITTKAPGYDIAGDNGDLIRTFQTVTAQEEQHALGATAILKNVGAFAPTACQYTFPVADLKSSVQIAETFTAIVLGALQQASVLFAQDGETFPVQLTSSIIGQEGEQNGLYRALLQEPASESPFLTTTPAPFAFSALQLFVVPGSCPYPLSDIPLPILPTISTNGGPVAFIDAKDQTLSLSADLTKSPNAAKYIGGDGSGLSFTYLSGQLMPISVPISAVSFSGNTIKFQASFPYTANVLQGYTNGALTVGSKFADANAVAAAALAAPAIIQVKGDLSTNLLAAYGLQQAGGAGGSGSGTTGGSCSVGEQSGDSEVVEICA